MANYTDVAKNFYKDFLKKHRKWVFSIPLIASLVGGGIGAGLLALGAFAAVTTTSLLAFIAISGIGAVIALVIAAVIVTAFYLHMRNKALSVAITRKTEALKKKIDGEPTNKTINKQITLNTHQKEKHNTLNTESNSSSKDEPDGLTKPITKNISSSIPTPDPDMDRAIEVAAKLKQEKFIETTDLFDAIKKIEGTLQPYENDLAVKNSLLELIKIKNTLFTLIESSDTTKSITLNIQSQLALILNLANSAVTAILANKKKELRDILALQTISLNEKNHFNDQIDKLFVIYTLNNNSAQAISESLSALMVHANQTFNEIKQMMVDLNNERLKQIAATEKVITDIYVRQESVDSNQQKSTENAIMQFNSLRLFNADKTKKPLDFINTLRTQLQNVETNELEAYLEDAINNLYIKITHALLIQLINNKTLSNEEYSKFKQTIESKALNKENIPADIIKKQFDELKDDILKIADGRDKLLAEAELKIKSIYFSEIYENNNQEPNRDLNQEIGNKLHNAANECINALKFQAHNANTNELSSFIIDYIEKSRLHAESYLKELLKQIDELNTPNNDDGSEPISEIESFEDEEFADIFEDEINEDNGYRPYK